MSTPERTPTGMSTPDTTARTTFEFDEADVALLREVLDSTYRDLKWEIADTDNSSFKQQLQTRERRMLSLLDAIGGPLPADSR